MAGVPPETQKARRRMPTGDTIGSWLGMRKILNGRFERMAQYEALAGSESAM